MALWILGAVLGSFSAAVAGAVELPFPAVEGLEWKYRVEAVPVQDPYAEPVLGGYEMKITQVRKSPEKTVYFIREYDDFTGKHRFSEWEASDAGVRVKDVDFPGVLSSDAPGFSFEFLRFPLVSGKKHDDGSWLTHVRGEEMVTVPGEDQPRRAWKLSVIGTRERDYTVVGDYWLVPGWGFVKASFNAWGWFLDSAVVERRKR